VKKIYFTVINDLSYDQRMQRICSSLASAGYDVTLVGRKLKSSKELKNQLFKQMRLKCFINKGKFFYLEYNIRLFLFFLFRRFDAICSVDLDTLLAGTLSAKLKRKKLIYDAHEYFTQVPEVVERPAVQKIWSRVAKFCIPKTDAAYTVCQSLADEFKKLYNKDFSVVRNLPFSIKAENNEFLPISKPLILIYQGMLNDGRGIEEMLHALTEFKSEEVQFQIVGEGDLSEKLRKLAAELQLNDKVKFLGFVEPAELKKITQQAHAGVNLLQNKGLNYYYSLANKFFDYVQAEKPSLNIDFPEYSLHNSEFEVSILLKDLEKESIVASIRRLLNEPELYQKLQENCKKAKEVWIWEKEEEKLISLYRKLWSNPLR
jgi:glycosyltransferase involved in cell wall biosynthesis